MLPFGRLGIFEAAGCQKLAYSFDILGLDPSKMSCYHTSPMVTMGHEAPHFTM